MNGIYGYMGKIIKLTESDLERIIKRVISEQGAALMSARVPGAVRGVGRFDLNKSANVGRSARLGFPEDSPVDEIPCELRPIERIEELFKSSGKFVKTPSDENFANDIAPKIVRELSGIGSGDVMKLIKQINTKGKLKAVIDNFEKNKSKYSNQNFFEWINNEILLNKEDIVDILSEYFSLPFCRKGCNCTIS